MGTIFGTIAKAWPLLLLCIALQACATADVTIEVENSTVAPYAPTDLAEVEFGGNTLLPSGPVRVVTLNILPSIQEVKAKTKVGPVLARYSICGSVDKYKLWSHVYKAGNPNRITAVFPADFDRLPVDDEPEPRGWPKKLIEEKGICVDIEFRDLGTRFRSNSVRLNLD